MMQAEETERHAIVALFLPLELNPQSAIPDPQSIIPQSAIPIGRKRP
ncbi:MAG: hypothetical protein HY789_07660 [Deltaproteobacteria bacterium]|nr:hypothetical protein [Deltaproteobacteria bacterium]